MSSQCLQSIEDRPKSRDAGVGDLSLGDLRFRALLTSEAWAALPFAVQKRFSKRLQDGATVVYIGRVTAMRFSVLGFILAQLFRLIGAPLPIFRDTQTPATVTVTEDKRSGGQIWTRIYGRKQGFPQVIHSVKRFRGPTGLEEYIGRGIGMALEISVEGGALVFRSAHYFFEAGRKQFKIPRWLTPGDITVTHRETSPTAFLFTLDLAHPVFGTLVRQEALYSEEMP